MPEPISPSKKPTTLIIVGGFVAALLIYGLWYGLASSDNSPKTTTQTSIAPSPTITALSPITPPSQSTGVGQPATLDNQVDKPATALSADIKSNQPTNAPPAHLVIRAVQPSWILISDRQGRTLTDRVLKTGESYAVPDQKGLNLTTGNGSGLILAIDGTDLPRLSTEQSKIQRNIPLDIDALRNLSLPLAD